MQCLFTRCMDECTEAVPDHWFAELLDEASAKKYQRFLLYSFVEHNQYASAVASTRTSPRSPPYLQVRALVFEAGL